MSRVILAEDGREVRLPVPAARLIEGALRNIRARRRPVHRWSAVVDGFGIGSTSAIALCRAFNLDPDEMLEPGDEPRHESED